MANTVNSNLIVPVVYGSLVRERIAGKVKVAPLAVNMGNLDEFKEVGETVVFPVYKYIGDAKDIAVGTKMTSVKMEQGQSTATVKMVAAPAVEVHDYDNKVALGNAIDEGATQQAISIARKLDADLIAEAQGTKFIQKIATKNAITEDELLDALGLFGDDRNVDDFAGIVCHSLMAKSFYKMDGFVNGNITHSADGNGIVRNDVIGYYMGIPVSLSDRLVDKKTGEGELVIIKKGALGYKPKEDVFVEDERVASERKTILYASQIYATKLIDEAGVVLCKTTAA